MQFEAVATGLNAELYNRITREWEIILELSCVRSSYILKQSFTNFSYTLDKLITDLKSPCVYSIQNDALLLMLQVIIDLGHM